MLEVNAGWAQRNGVRRGDRVRFEHGPRASITGCRVPSVTVFGSHPLLGVTIERRGADQDDVHMHPAGQGVWVARMAAELESHPILCGFIGGETGTVLRPLMEQLDAELRLVHTEAAAGCYVVDRRSGERDIVATAWSDPPSRHEIDDLFSVTVAAALESEVLVVCGRSAARMRCRSRSSSNLVADARAGGTKTIVDLSPPAPEQRARGRPRLREAERLAARRVHRGRRRRSPSRSGRAHAACSMPARVA